MNLFVYGTLKQSESRQSLLDGYVTGPGRVARVAGRLFQPSGVRWPAAKFGGSTLIVGELYEVIPGVEELLLKRLDRIEGAPTLFARRDVVVDCNGELIEAVAYEGVMESLFTHAKLVVDGDWST